MSALNTNNQEFAATSGSTSTIIGTTGQPAATVGFPGDLATDPNDPSGPVLYIKGNTGWKFVATGV